MAALAGIMLSLLFGFVIRTSSDPDLQFIRIMRWIITIFFISTSPFIAASMAYHMRKYEGKTKNGKQHFEDITNAFGVSTFFYVLTITLLMLVVIS